MNSSLKFPISFGLNVALLVGALGCAPQQTREQTKVERTSDLKIRANEAGKVEVSRSTGTPAPDSADADASPSGDE